MSNIEIRNSVVPKDFKKFLLELSNQTKLTFNYFGIISTESIEQILETELTRKDKIQYFIYLKNELISYSFFSLFEKPTKKKNCILGIVVGDNWQNQGFGKKICQAMINDAWEKGMEKIWLTVQYKNKKALQLYTLLGFEVEGIFMNDEIIEDEYQTIISMAIFKNQIEHGQRLKIWNEIGKNLS